MVIGVQELLIGCGAILTTWIFNNSKLREGVTDWFVSSLGIDSYSITNHNVLDSLRALKFESKTTEFDNKIKSELFHYYIELVIDTMNELVLEILEKEKKMSFEQVKKLIKQTMYEKLTNIDLLIDKNIKMPKKLQDKFDKFCNYLSMQHTYAIEHALQSSNKKLLLIQVLDAIDNNSRWFLFVATEMFEGFNGTFDALLRTDVFINKKNQR